MNLAANTKTNEILKPLERKDSASVFDVKSYQFLRTLFRNKCYGTYLVGGGPGTGKSSLVQMASTDHTVPVNVSFSDEDKILDDFLLIILQAFVMAVEEKIDLSSYQDNYQEITDYLTTCEELLLYNTVTENILTRDSEKSDQTHKVMTVSQEGSAEGKIGPSFKFLNIGFGVRLSENGNRSKENTEKDKEAVTVRITKKERDNDIWAMVQQGIKLLSKHSFAFIYDNLHYVGADVLVRLLKHYNQVFKDSDCFTFLLISDSVYHQLGKNDLIENPLYLYFTGSVYIGMLSLPDTLRFIRMMFGEESIRYGYELYYYSLGNLRLINSQYYFRNSHQPLTLFKAILLKELLANPGFPQVNSAQRDVLVRRYKRAIEYIFSYQLFSVKELSAELEKEDTLFRTWPGYEYILRYLVNLLKSLVPEGIEEVENGSYLLNLSYLLEHADDVGNAYLAYRRLSQPRKWEEIQIEDLYQNVSVNDLRERFGKPFEVREDIEIYMLEDMTAEQLVKEYSNLLLTNLNASNIRLIQMQLPDFSRTFSLENGACEYIFTLVLMIENGEYQKACCVKMNGGYRRNCQAISLLANNFAYYGVQMKTITLHEYDHISDLILGMKIV